jgi:hypothetical protein
METRDAAGRRWTKPGFQPKLHHLSAPCAHCLLTRERRMPPDDQKTPFEMWKDTIDTSAKNPAWNGHDAAIKATVTKYNEHLKSAPGFTALDWKLIKAMVWTESGGPTARAWTSRPMQIGNAGDPGLTSLLGGKEGGELIIPPDIASGLTAKNAGSEPERNIEAGVGYLLMRAASYKFEDVWSANDPITEYKVGSGDSVDHRPAQRLDGGPPVLAQSRAPEGDGRAQAPQARPRPQGAEGPDQEEDRRLQVARQRHGGRTLQYRRQPLRRKARLLPDEDQMKPSPRLLLLALLLCAPAAACAKAPAKPAPARPATAPSGAPPLQLGVFEGTGRACSGLLKITPKRMSWNTPFSPCPASAFTLVERRQKGATTQWAYQFVGAPKSCLYKVVVLEKTVPPDVWAWNVYGFTSMKAYKADDKVNQLNCYLVKAD